MPFIFDPENPTSQPPYRSNADGLLYEILKATKECAAGAGGGGGTSWLNGTTAPGGGLGSNGNYYLNTVTNELYLKTAGTWALVATLGGSGSSGLVFATVADLKANTILIPIANKTVDVLGYYTPADGGGGTFYYNPLSTLADDGGMNIKPTVGAGAYERVYTGSDIQTAFFGATGDLQNITVDVNAGALTITKKVAAAQVITGGTGLYRYFGSNGAGVRLNGMEIFAALTPAVVAGDMIEQFRAGVWVRIGIVTGGYDGGGGGPYIVYITNENGFTDNGQYHSTRVTKLVNSTFAASDIGKTLVINEARLFAAYNTLPVGLNCKITAVSGGGVATFVNLDTGRGVPANATGTITNGEAISNAVIFRESTDAIGNAVKYCENNGKGSPVLPAGTVGIMPIFSTTWAAKPIFAVSYAVQKSPFWFMGNVALRGVDVNKSFLSVHYAVPQRVWAGAINHQLADTHEFICNLFFIHPTANVSTIKDFKDFSVVYPTDEGVVQPYRTFVDFANSAYNTPLVHAQKLRCENFNQVSPSRNAITMYSLSGGIYEYGYEDTPGFTRRGLFNPATTYNPGDIVTKTDGIIYAYIIDANGTTYSFTPWQTKVVDHAEISFKNCILENGGIDVKQTLRGNPTLKAAKKFKLLQSKIYGGSLPVCRNYTGTMTQTGADYFLTIAEKNYSPYNFNAHKDYGQRNVLLTPIEVKRRVTRTITAITQSGSNFVITVNSNFTDPTNANGKLWMEVGNYQYELYINGGVSLVNASPTVTVPVAAANRTLEEMLYYVGKEVRLYSIIDYCMLTDFGDKRTIKIGAWSIITTKSGGVPETKPFTTSCLGLSNLDILVNATLNDTNDGITGHIVYNSTAIQNQFEDVEIYDAPDLFRISASGNLAGIAQLKNIKMLPVVGKYAFATGRTKVQPYYHFEGEVDIDNVGTFDNKYQVFGKLKNSRLIGFNIGGKSEIENCSFENNKFVGAVKIKDCNSSYSYMLAGADIVADNFTGQLIVQTGKALISNSAIEVRPDSTAGFFADQDNLLGALNITMVNCPIQQYIGYSPSLTTSGRLKLKQNIHHIGSGVIADDKESIGNNPGIDFEYTLVKGVYPSLVSYLPGYVHAFPNNYPIAVIDSSTLDFPDAIGKVLFIDAGRADSYRINATAIDDIRISNRVQNHANDYNLFAQSRYADGVAVYIIPEVAGVIINNTARINSLSVGSRPVGIAIKFVYSKLNNKWFEVLNY